MTTLTASANAITLSFRFTAPGWLVRMAQRAQARANYQTLQQLTLAQQRDIGQYAEPQRTLSIDPWS